MGRAVCIYQTFVPKFIHCQVISPSLRSVRYPARHALLNACVSPTAQAAKRNSRTFSKICRKAGSGARHIVRYVSRKGSHATQGSQGVLVVIIAAAAFLAGLFGERLRAEAVTSGVAEAALEERYTSSLQGAVERRRSGSLQEGSSSCH